MIEDNPSDQEVIVTQKEDKWEVIFINGFGLSVVGDFDTAERAEDIASRIRKDLEELKSEYEGIFSREVHKPKNLNKEGGEVE